MDDGQWSALNEELANGFDAKGVVLKRHGLTYDSYLAEARERATRPAVTTDDAFGATEEIDRRKLSINSVPFVEGTFQPAPALPSTSTDAGETAIHVRPNLDVILPFKKRHE